MKVEKDYDFGYRSIGCGARWWSRQMAMYGQFDEIDTVELTELIAAAEMAGKVVRRFEEWEE